MVLWKCRTDSKMSGLETVEFSDGEVDRNLTFFVVVPIYFLA
jgi:hypothetical protein